MPGQARTIREQAGLWLRELAKVLSVSAATLSRWESGARRPRAAHAIAYGALLAELQGRAAS